MTEASHSEFLSFSASSSSATSTHAYANRAFLMLTLLYDLSLFV